MIRENWNQGWTLLRQGESPMMAAMMGGGQTQTITLPHDAMIHEERTEATRSQHQTGFYPGGTYTYMKSFEAPAEWENKTVLLEFEGVYENARVYINGDYAGGYPNGYSEFTVCADDFLNYGRINTVTVVANSREESSRWYSGSGIYRNVNLLIGNEVHIRQNSLRITVNQVHEDLAVAAMDLDIIHLGRTQRKVTLHIEVCEGQNHTVTVNDLPVTLFGNDEEHVSTRIEIENPQFWSCESPVLYTCRAEIRMDGEVCDKANERFGIRTIEISADQGLKMNGIETKLRGACIHHDNGPLGAATFFRAEERRIEKLKAAGFNCVRMSHHPMSRAMLDACDKLGMLVLDELCDCWTRSKNNNDYAEKFPFFWETDVQTLIAKDYNHPSVIMYVSGNEIQEAASSKGAQMNRKITALFHQLDHTRPVTVAINGLLSCMDHMGEIMCDITGMTMEQMMTMQAQAQQPSSDAGADAANGSTDLMKGPMADAFAANRIVTDLLDEFASITDVTGYNYLTARHEMEHALRPNRVILGTETLPSDLIRLWRIVKNNHHVIGDMTWTGWDYLGEAGSGVVYYDGRTGFMPNWPISVAGMGDLDILGNRRSVSFVREIVYGLRKEPHIAVEPVDKYGQKATHSAWPWNDETHSWTWKGYEGHPAKINVYSDAEEVELLLNNVSLGRKPSGEANDFVSHFEINYEPGELKAICYRNGLPAESTTLATAGEKTHLDIQIDKEILTAGEQDLCYLMISLRDDQNRLNPQAVQKVTVQVEGAGSLAAMGNADVATENRYDCSTWETWQGCMLAIVRSGRSPGTISVRINTETEQHSLELKVQ